MQLTTFPIQRPHEILRTALVENVSRVRKMFEDSGWMTEIDVEAAGNEDGNESVVLRVHLPKALVPEMLRARASSVQAIKEALLTSDPTSLNPEDPHTCGDRPEQLDDRSYHSPTP